MSSPTSPRSAKFYMVNGFTNQELGGNPAAVLHLDSDLDEAKMKTIANNLNQPIVVFVTVGPASDPKPDSSTVFNIRYFYQDYEVSLCGHGTLCAAHTLFATLVPRDVSVVRFQTRKLGLVTAQRTEAGFLAMELPNGRAEEIPMASEEGKRIRGVVCKALKVETADIEYLGKGGLGYEYYGLVVLGSSETLEGRPIDTEALVSILSLTRGKRLMNMHTQKDSGYAVNVWTAASPTPNALFQTRMFAPIAGLHEDHVCGTAHCLSGPYWAKKLEQGGNMMKARMASPRGGDLKVTLKGGDIVRVEGQCRDTANGHYLLD